MQNKNCLWAVLPTLRFIPPVGSCPPSVLGWLSSHQDSALLEPSWRLGLPGLYTVGVTPAEYRTRGMVISPREGRTLSREQIFVAREGLLREGRAMSRGHTVFASSVQRLRRRHEGSASIVQRISLRREGREGQGVVAKAGRVDRSSSGSKRRGHESRDEAFGRGRVATSREQGRETWSREQ